MNIELRIVTNVSVVRLVGKWLQGFVIAKILSHHFHGDRTRDFTFGFSDVLASKQELTIEIGHIDRVHVNGRAMTKAAQRQIFCF